MAFNKVEVLCGVLLCVGLALLPPTHVWITQSYLLSLFSPSCIRSPTCMANMMTGSRL